MKWNPVKAYLIGYSEQYFLENNDLEVAQQHFYQVVQFRGWISIVAGISFCCVSILGYSEQTFDAIKVPFAIAVILGLFFVLYKSRRDDYEILENKEQVRQYCNHLGIEDEEILKRYRFQGFITKGQVKRTPISQTKG